MKGLFDPEGKFMYYGGKLWDMMWLNVLVILCSLPIITMGPALTAMHYVLLKIYRDEDSGITKMFFKSFFMNFKQGVAIQLMGMALAYLLYISLSMFWTWEAEGTKIVFWAVVAICVIVFCTWQWSLILLSRYANTVRNTIKSALAACMVHPLRSLLMGAFFLVPGFVLLFTEKIVIFVAALGFTGPGMINTLWYNQIFKKLETAAVESSVEELTLEEEE